MGFFNILVRALYLDEPKPMTTTTRRLRWYRLAAGVVLLLYLLQVAAAFLSARLMLGIVLQLDDQGPRITDIDPGSPADRAGLARGVHILAMNDHPVTNLGDISRALRASNGRALRILVRQGRKEQAYTVTPGIAPQYHLLILNFLVLTVYLAAGAIALGGHRLDHRLRLLAVFCLVVALDVATEGNYLYFMADTRPLGVAEMALAGLQFALVFHLFSLIPSPAPWLRPGLLVALYPGMPLIAAALDAVALKWIPVPTGFFHAVLLAFRFNLLYLFWGFTVLGVLIYQYRRHTSRSARGQLRQILLGLVPWLLFQGTAPWLTGHPQYDLFWFPVLDAATHLIFALTLLLAIFRYNLFDLNELISRQAILRYLPLALVLFCGTIAVAALVALRRETPGTGTLWLAAGLGFIAGLAYYPVRNRLDRRWLDRLVPRDRQIGRRLRHLSRRLDALGDRTAMEDYLAHHLPRALSCQWARIHWVPGADPLINRRTRSAAHFLPLTHQGRRLGTLLVGPIQGPDYNARERELLALFADGLAARLAGLELRHRMDHDPLTGLWSREKILERVRTLASAHLNEGVAFSVAMLDLDDFKIVNDRLGHLAGDQALEATGRLIRERLPAGAAAGRFGGEEFLLVLPGHDKARHCQWLEDLRQALSDIHLTAPKGTATHHLSASIGIASVNEVSADDPNELIRRLIGLADDRLYQAKATGKNRCVS